MSAHTPASPPRATRRLGAALVAVLALFAPLAAASAAHAADPAATLALELSSSSATEGDTIVATVTGTAISDLYAYDLVLTVTEGVLESADAPTGPEGGFTSAVDGPGTVTVSHTRLGTSPGLSGTVVLATVPLHAVGSGTARVELTSVRLVSSTGEAAEQTEVASTTVELEALPTPEPSVSPSASASPSPSASASAVPAVSGPSDLATTGVDATAWLISGAVGVALIAVGALIVVRRRQGVRE